MQKNLWICLILLKNRWLKYRFFALFRRVQQKADAPGEKPVRSQRARSKRPTRLARNPCAWSTVWSKAAGESRSPKVISASVDLLHKIFIYRKDELVKYLPAT